MMDDDDGVKSFGQAAFLALEDIADEMLGDLNSFKRLRDFFREETSHLPPFAIERIRTAVEDHYKVCESHIEIIALVKMMSANVAADGQMPSYPYATSERVPSKFVTITPQVKIGPYRADFIVDGERRAFLVECDGLDFHDAAADARRDAAIEADFGMKTFRLAGKEIWRSSAWLPTFGLWCRGKFFDRHRPVWIQELEASVRDEDGHQ